MAGDVDAPVVLGGFPKSGLDAYGARPAMEVATSARSRFQCRRSKAAAR